MQIIHFPKLAMGSTFAVDGETYTKTSELVFRDAYGLEHYIDPLFDIKLGKELAGQETATQEPDVSAKIVKEVE